MITVMMFPNGVTAAFDGEEQIPELQRKGWLETWLLEAEKRGYVIENMNITLPDNKKAHPFRVPDGWNWRIE
jgi:hypothetical protein